MDVPSPGCANENSSSPKSESPQCQSRGESLGESWGENSGSVCFSGKRKRTAPASALDKFQQLNDEMVDVEYEQASGSGKGKSAYTLPLPSLDSIEPSSSIQNVPEMNNKPKKSTFTLQECVDHLQRFSDFTPKQKIWIAEKFFMDKNYRRLWMSFNVEMKEAWLKDKCLEE